MKIGCCLGVDENFSSDIELMKNINCDFVELPLNNLVKQEEKEFSRTLDILNENLIKCEVVNVFLPSDIKIVGNDVSLTNIKEYLNLAFERAKRVGTEVIVFGSGGARNVPDGFDRIKAYNQLSEFLLIVSTYLEQYNITLAIENLNSTECNILNTIEECAQLAKVVGKNKITLLLDYYHFQMEKEDVETITKLYKSGTIFSHMHIADVNTNRGFPFDNCMIKDFFSILDNINYNKRLSIEGKTTNFKEDLIKSMNLLKTN